MPPFRQRLSEVGSAFKALVKAVPLTAVPANSNLGFWGTIRESFAGAWQQNIEVDPPRSILAFSAVYACVSIIAGDIAKMSLRLMKLQPDKTTKPLTFGDMPELDWALRLLKRPNRYQTLLKFIEQYITCKLLWGNVYVLKSRNSAGVIEALYVLDPQRVTPLVASDGSIWYKLLIDNLAQLGKDITVPASEIIHDTMVCLWHPLVGVSPIYACAMSATQGNKIQANSATFFDNMSRPSGVLTAPGAIGDETASRIKAYWESNFSGSKIGRLAVLGDGLKYDAMTIPAVDAQLIDQLKWTVEDVARAFHMPLFKIGGALPAQINAEMLQTTYYSDCLQVIIESGEASFDHGFALPDGVETEFNLNALLRMDSAARYERTNKAVAGGWLAPNEGRLLENYSPAEGGDSPMMQQQNWSLAQLAARDAPKDSSSVSPPPVAATINIVASKEKEIEEVEDDEVISLFSELYVSGMQRMTDQISVP